MSAGCESVDYSDAFWVGFQALRASLEPVHILVTAKRAANASD